VKAGDPVNTAFGDANIAEILADQGRLAEAEELLREAAAVWTAAGDLWGRGFAERLLGVVAARSGRAAEAAALLDSSRAAFAKMGALPDVAATDVAIAEVLVLQGRGAEALQVLEGITAADALDQLAPAWHRCRGIALIQSGQPGRHELETALTLAREQESDHQIALALDAIDQIEQRDGDEAAEIFRRLDVIAPPVYPFPIGGAVRDRMISGT
jgi:tetratricopeptide (TPR) repeat protein